MELIGGVVLLALGVAMVRVAMPGKEGVHPAFFRNPFVTMVWPVACLMVLVLGATAAVRGFL
jgi:hypothetical protein